jgi:hypothetical protein
MGRLGDVAGGLLGGELGRKFGGERGQKVGEAIGSIAGSYLPFKKGGRVPGKKGRARRAIVHGGEYVLPVGVAPTKAQKKAVAKRHSKSSKMHEKKEHK